MSRIVIVGGGAAGIELSTLLAKANHKKHEIILVEPETDHYWKPRLHEIAAGTFDRELDSVCYFTHGAINGYQHYQAAMTDINREDKMLVVRRNDGTQAMVKYDYLVVAVGAVSNDFNTTGARDNCIFLDSPEQAHRFRSEMNNQFMKLHANKDQKTVDIAIVGAGATGVELSAELHNAVQELHNYGFGDLDSSRLNINLVEAGERILPALPPRISQAAHNELTKLGVNVRTATMVTKADETGLTTKDGEHIPAQIMVWAAGIKAPDFMKDIAGLETNRINQLVVKPTLETTRDDNIYVIGDLASCVQEDGSFVPPRAQAAHQMASRCFSNIVAKLSDREQKPYIYSDHGSLVSLSRFSTVGSLMGNLSKGSMMVEGRIARMVYISLYRMHQMALHGMFKTGLIMLVGRINRVLRPSLKLH